MTNKPTILLVLSVAALTFVLVHSASVDLKTYSKRADSNAEMSVEEATKLCNASFAIKMGKPSVPLTCDLDRLNSSPVSLFQRLSR